MSFTEQQFRELRLAGWTFVNFVDSRDLPNQHFSHPDHGDGFTLSLAYRRLKNPTRSSTEEYQANRLRSFGWKERDPRPENFPGEALLFPSELRWTHELLPQDDYPEYLKGVSFGNAIVRTNFAERLMEMKSSREIDE